MLVTDDHLVEGRELISLCQAAERGGVTSIQLRLKLANPRELLVALRALKLNVRVPVLVNDRLDVALAGGADGVHLGPDDMPVHLARKVAPPGFLIGVSVGSDGEIANGDGADYWGIGPYRVSTTKAGAGAPLGGAGLGHFVAYAGSRPCMAIGGVEPSDVLEILRAGASGVAVVSGILGAEDVEAAARRYAEALGQR